MKRLFLLFVLASIIMYNKIFAQNHTICIPYGKSILVDGLISLGEWDDADSVHIINNNQKTTVKYKHDSLNLYFVYLGHLESAGHVPELVLDLNNDKSSTWLADDWWFHVSATDCESQGVPNNYNNCQVIQPGWEGVPNMTSGPPFTDTIEIKITFTKVGISLYDTIGIAFDVTNTYNEWIFWPSGANINNPSTWAIAYFCKNPSLGIRYPFMSKKITSNYPNPFHFTTTISFSLFYTEYVTLQVFDIFGREIATLVDGELNPGEHSVVFDAKELPSGVYFYRLTTPTFSQTKLMEVLK